MVRPKKPREKSYKRYFERESNETTRIPYTTSYWQRRQAAKATAGNGEDDSNPEVSAESQESSDNESILERRNAGHSETHDAVTEDNGSDGQLQNTDEVFELMRDTDEESDSSLTSNTSKMYTDDATDSVSSSREVNCDMESSFSYEDEEALNASDNELSEQVHVEANISMSEDGGSDEQLLNDHEVYEYMCVVDEESDSTLISSTSKMSTDDPTYSISSSGEVGHGTEPSFSHEDDFADSSFERTGERTKTAANGHQSERLGTSLASECSNDDDDSASISTSEHSYEEPTSPAISLSASRHSSASSDSSTSMNLDICNGTQNDSDTSENQDVSDNCENQDDCDNSENDYDNRENQDDSDNNNENDGDEIGDRIDPFKRLKAAFGKEINVNVHITVGEIISNALALCKKHNWGHSEKEGLMKFASSVLNSGYDNLPNSRYLLDKHLYSQRDMQLHFFCVKCSHFLCKISMSNNRLSQMVCSNEKCKTVNNLRNLSKSKYFVVFDLPSQIELLLGDAEIRSKLNRPSTFVNQPDDKKMRDLYHGTMYRHFANYVKDNISEETHVMSFTLSVDSASLCQFSGQKICPCFIMLNELPPILRMENLLVAGLWFGKVKEKLDLFLPPIVQHIYDLSDKGFTLKFGDEVWNCQGFLIACCADSVARCDVQGIHSHRGDFPCSWCLIEGEEGESSRVFRFQVPPAPPRTLQELVEDAAKALATKEFVNGVKYLSPLAVAPMFHSVNGFIVDQMHAKDEGTTKSFVRAWIGKDPGCTARFLAPDNNSKLLAQRLENINPPVEFRKGLRGIEDFGHWTGRELENFGILLSVPCLVDILSPRYLNHWSLYVQAIDILLSSELSIDTLNIAEALLEEFCKQTEELYGECMMRFNLHLLLHFAANSRRWGPCFIISAYAFEYGNQRAKKLIHDVNYIPNQVCRGISEDNAMFLVRTQYNTPNIAAFTKSIAPTQHSVREKIVGDIKLQGISKPFKPNDEELWFLEQMKKDKKNIEEYPILVKSGCRFAPKKPQTNSDNSYCKLVDGKIMKIKRILYDEVEDQIMCVVQRVHCDPVYCHPSVIRLDRNLCYLFKVTCIDDDVKFIDVRELKTICVNMSLDHGHFVRPMPNIINMY